VIIENKKNSAPICFVHVKADSLPVKHDCKTGKKFAGLLYIQEKCTR